MIQKTENCVYCGAKMESKTAKKKFCCTLHRVYWNREKQLNKILAESEYKEESEKTFEQIVLKGEAGVKENKKDVDAKEKLKVKEISSAAAKTPFMSDAIKKKLGIK